MHDTLTAASELSGSQSVDRALRLLAIVGRDAENGKALSEIVEESGLNKPTARRLLIALMRARLVEQDTRSRRYYLGDEAFVLGRARVPPPWPARTLDGEPARPVRGHDGFELPFGTP